MPDYISYSEFRTALVLLAFAGAESGGCHTPLHTLAAIANHLLQKATLKFTKLLFNTRPLIRYPLVK